MLRLPALCPLGNWRLRVRHSRGILPAPGGGSLGLPCKPPRKAQGKEHEHDQMRENMRLSECLLWMPDPVQDPNGCQWGHTVTPQYGPGPPL